jgi:hypothetical protein
VGLRERARKLDQEAIRTTAPWIKTIGSMLEDRADRNRWVHAAITVAAYRDRYGITSSKPLGGEPGTDIQRLVRARAEAPIRNSKNVVSVALRPGVATGREGVSL